MAAVCIWVAQQRLSTGRARGLCGGLRGSGGLCSFCAVVIFALGVPGPNLAVFQHVCDLRDGLLAWWCRGLARLHPRAPGVYRARLPAQHDKAAARNV